MMISTRGRYALRLMIDLAINGAGGKTISLKEIASRQGISLKYLEQIISVFNKAGYVRSIRGPQGGYQLTMPEENYTVGMILRLTEGDLAPVECLTRHAMPCDKKHDCTTLVLWRKMQDAVNNVVDNMTLADLVALERQKENPGVKEC